LEIILSDDCSTDRTFEIMKEMAAAYRGPHEVALNRNVRNVGIGQHVSNVFTRAKGQFIVVAAGDDISFAERAARLVEAWKEAQCAPCSIVSDCETIDEDGRVLHATNCWVLDQAMHREGTKCATLQSVIYYHLPSIVGAMHGCSREVFDFFGPLPQDVLHEDYAFSFRAMLLGGIRTVRLPLVKWRRHASALSAGFETDHAMSLEMYDRAEERMRLWASVMFGCYISFEQDIRQAVKEKLVSESDACVLRDSLEEKKRIVAFRSEMLSGSLIGRLKAFFAARGLSSGRGRGRRLYRFGWRNFARAALGQRWFWFMRNLYYVLR
jgi:glycosyltransferase involved in cell wall biosynthesis